MNKKTKRFFKLLLRSFIQLTVYLLLMAILAVATMVFCFWYNAAIRSLVLNIEFVNYGIP